MEWKKDSFVVSDDVSKLDLNVIYEFLTNSYWGKGRTKELISDSIQNSFSLGLYYNDSQIGFARVITDYCTFAYLCDVFILEQYRRKHLGHFLMDCLFKHPKLNSLKWLLKTSAAQNLYQGNGALSARVKWPAIKVGGVEVFPDAEMNFGEVGITGGMKLLSLKMESEGMASSPYEGFLYSYFKGELRVGTLKFSSVDFQVPLMETGGHLSVPVFAE